MFIPSSPIFIISLIPIDFFVYYIEFLNNESKIYPQNQISKSLIILQNFSKKEYKILMPTMFPGFFIFNNKTLFVLVILGLTACLFLFVLSHL